MVNSLHMDDTEPPYINIDRLIDKIPDPETIGVKELVDSLNDIDKYLFGATALDCSIMLTFRNIFIDDIARWVQRNYFIYLFFFYSKIY